MFESIQQHLEAPIPSWVFWVIVAILWYRDYAIKKGLVMVGAILDKYSMTISDQ
jgi:hypothetical protein